LAVKKRLLDKDRKTPKMRNERQMMVMEKILRALCCQRLLSVSLL